MKKLLITLLFITFFCSDAFAELTSFQEKLKKLDEIAVTNSYTPKQAQLFLNMFQGFTDCSPSSNGSGYICTTPDLLCLIDQPNNKISIKCVNEKDLDKFFAL